MYELITPAHDDYDTARRVWNRAVDRRPAAITRCSDAAGAAAALAHARSANLEVAVRGGGHGFPGFATTEGGLVLDLGPMKTIEITGDVATVGPGVRWGELTDAAAPTGLAPVGGHVGGVGVAGLTLGGGNGWLGRSYGLACDNLLSAEVLTASGEVVTASPDDNPDLFWGLRGGGGNFGIVLQYTLRLRPVDQVIGGMIFYPLEEAPALLRTLAEWEAPREASVLAAIMGAPPFLPEPGRPVFLLAVCWLSGDRDLAWLRGLGTPLADLIGPTTFAALQHANDGQDHPTPYRMRHHLGGPLTEPLIETLVEFGSAPPSPATMILLAELGGAIAEVGPSETAYFHRTARWCLEIAAAWPGDAPAAPHVTWADDLWQATRDWSVGAEVNHLAEEGVRLAYGDNLPRLTELKRKWDPENIFHLNQNVSPT
ncbi:FAD-binding oxidoreductase [Herbidospora daliensis]|uniref:FAD-binding oxidoreductase n=1 Tax=Herbidospora daliensis TaxID=295585 RepID=UPI000786224B|nr:FAD-binding oxidoreductase [Herbidospora daliensis]